MKILITGANGQLGSALQRVYAGTPGVVLLAYDRDHLDVTKFSSIEAVSNEFNPDVIINCAAYNAVEKADDEISFAYEINAFAPYLLAQTAKKIAATLVHVSTDYVFDGLKGEYSEADCPHPLNVYGAAKLAGEQLVQMTHEKSYVIRTSWLFGKNAAGLNQNFIGLMLSKAQKAREVSVVDDQVGVPTYALDLAGAIRQLLEKPAPFGLYHLTNSGTCSRYEQAKKIFSLANLPVSLTAITTAESQTKVRRPAKTVLLNKKWEALGFAPLRSWDAALADYMAEVVGL